MNHLKSRGSCLPIYLMITVSVLLVYLPSLSGDFLLDDHFLIENNPLIQSPPSLAAYLNQEDGIIPGKNWESSHTGYYRPLVNFFHRMDYLLWGMDPRGFRFTNVLLHLITSLMIFKLLRIFIKESTIAFLATCVFALHPVNTESVSWISSRNNILAALFAVGCFYFFFKYSEDRKISRLALASLFFGLSIFSKEFGLLLLPILFLHHILFKKGGRYALKKFAVYIPMIFIIMGYLLLRNAATGTWIAPSGAADGFQRLYYVPYLLSWNIRLILFPFGLHSFIVRYPAGYVNWQFFTGIISVVIMFAVVWKLRKDHLAVFAILSFFISLLPVLNIVRTASVTLVSMRWLYFPMIFAALFFAGRIHRSIQLNRFLSYAILIVIFIYMGIYSFMLNRYLWHDENAFYTFEVHQFNNVYYYGGMAEHRFNQGDLSGAEHYFKIAIETRPRASRNYINYSALLLEKKQAADALAILDRAENLHMTKKERMEWFNNLGNANFNLGNYNQAIQYINQAISLDFDAPYLWGNLGAGYAKIGAYEKSIESVRKGLSRFPDSISLKKTLSLIYIQKGEYESALSVMESIPKESWQANGIGQLYSDTRRKMTSK